MDGAFLLSIFIKECDFYGLFSSLFHSRDAPQNRTAGSGYTSGKVVTERGAMQMTVVYSCVRILAEAVAGLLLNLYRYTGDGGKEKTIDHPLHLMFHDEQNPEMSFLVFRETSAPLGQHLCTDHLQRQAVYNLGLSLGGYCRVRPRSGQ